MIWLCILILLPYGYYCGLTRFSYFIFPECLRGWLDYPGHSTLFSRPFRGVPRVNRWFIMPLLLWIPDWHFFSSPTVASLDTRLAFLFKTSSWRPSSLQAVPPLLLWTPDWHFSSRPTVLSLDIRPAFLLFYFP